MLDTLSYNSSMNVSKPLNLDATDRFWNTDNKVCRKKMKFDTLSSDGNYDFNSIESRDQKSIAKNSIERFILFSRSSNSNKLL